MRSVYGVMKSFVGGVVAPGPLILFAADDDVSLKRKNSLSFSATTWSKRMLVESSDPGFDQLPRNGARPFGSVHGSEAEAQGWPLGYVQPGSVGLPHD